MDATKGAVELFHLLFLEQLGPRLDKRLYALKGGCNLRFFFNSIRYSEDMDLDVHTVAVTTLENLVSKILDSQPFSQLLRTRSLEIVEYSAPKQTSTTQRWKIKLKVKNQSLAINTKIEFSRREKGDSAELANISLKILTLYGLRPIFVSHYPATIALEQKILALIMRTETQARDIFDIYLLINAGAHFTKSVFSYEQLTQAIDNARIVSFGHYNSQVVSYLELEQQALYADANIWSTIQDTVVNYLQEAKNAIN